MIELLPLAKLEISGIVLTAILYLSKLFIISLLFFLVMDGIASKTREISFLIIKFPRLIGE